MKTFLRVRDEKDYFPDKVSFVVVFLQLKIFTKFHIFYLLD